MNGSERKGREWASRVYADKLRTGDLPNLGRGYTPEVRAARAVQGIAERKLYVGAARSSRKLLAPLPAWERAFWRGAQAWSLEQEQAAKAPQAWEAARGFVQRFVAKGGDLGDPIDLEWLQSKNPEVHLGSVIARLKADGLLAARGAVELLELEEASAKPGRRKQLRGEPDFRKYDLILINTSGGKDSLVSMDLAVQKAKAEDSLDRVVAVHAILEGMEWPGVLDLVKKQCKLFNIPLELVQAGGAWPSWYDYATHRREWPGFGTRFCTRGWKSTPIDALVTVYKKAFQKQTGEQQIGVLQIMGMRADESAERGKRYFPFQHEVGRSNTERWTDLWLPLYHWTAKQVWAHIRKRKLPYHPVYDMGMERLSCAFCPLAGRHEIIQAAKVAYKLDPKLLARAAKVEAAIGKPIIASKRLPPVSLQDLQKALRAGKPVVAERDPDDQGEWCHPFADEDE